MGGSELGHTFRVAAHLLEGVGLIATWYDVIEPIGMISG